MRKINFTTFLITIVILFNLRTSNAQEDNQLIVGHKVQLFSKVLNEQREIWIHVPESYDDSQIEKYPVIYLLDGKANFYPLIGIITHLNNCFITPEMIIVAIPNTNRYRDLTTSHIGDSTDISGGGETFTQFLDKELVPYIDNKFRTAPYRTFIGHSYGGLLVINTIIKHQELFENYIAIEPSLRWDNQKLQKESIIALKQNKFKDKSLFIAIANPKNEEMDLNSVENDKSNSTLQTRFILEFSKTADSINYNNLNFKWKYYSNEIHGTIPLVAEYDALRYMFSWYTFNDWVRFANPNISAKEMSEIIVTHYEKASNILGYSVRPKEWIVNDIAYEALNYEIYDKAYELFKLNIKYYPNSANCFDSMGDYYVSQSDTIKAIENYSKAFKIENNPQTKLKIEQLINK
jgi:hypothetical protein